MFVFLPVFTSSFHSLNASPPCLISSPFPCILLSHERAGNCYYTGNHLQSHLSFFPSSCSSSVHFKHLLLLFLAHYPKRCSRTLLWSKNAFSSQSQLFAFSAFLTFPSAQSRPFLIHRLFLLWPVCLAFIAAFLQQDCVCAYIIFIKLWSFSPSKCLPLWSCLNALESDFYDLINVDTRLFRHLHVKKHTQWNAVKTGKAISPSVTRSHLVRRGENEMCWRKCDGGYQLCNFKSKGPDGGGQVETLVPILIWPTSILIYWLID